MVPRVQTFAWRLLRKALPTGKRASKVSKHISEYCARCGSLEDEMHMFFLCGNAVRCSGPDAPGSRTNRKTPCSLQYCV
jgi:hypothetical protein